MYLIYLSIYLSVYLSISLSLVSLCLSVSLSVCLSVCSVCLSVCKLENGAILRDFLNFWTWQRQKRNMSARLPQFSKLTTSKTKQFCETFFKNGKLSAQLTASYQCVLQFFHSTCLKYCAHTKPHLNVQKCSVPLSFFPLLTSKCASRHNGVHFFDISTSKSGPSMVFFSLLTSKCASRHNGVHFIGISTSKRGRSMVCFVHFDFEMCFAHKRGAFRHRNFQKCSKAEVLCTFWLGNVFRATTACNFLSLISLHGSAPAALASLLFDPPEPQIIEKTQCFATFLPFRAPESSFFGDFLFFDLLSSSFSSLTLPISAFHLSILSEVWLLKLPSKILYTICQ